MQFRASVIVGALLAVAVALATAHSESHHDCIHDRVAEKALEYHRTDVQEYSYAPPSPDQLARMGDMEISSRRQDGWSPIRVTVDYSHVTLSGSTRDFLVNRLMPAAERWIEESLRVRPVSGSLRLSTGSCYDDIRISQSSYASTDLVIFVGTKSTSGNTLAYATSCRSDQKGRATAGMVNFGPSRLEPNGDFERQLATAIHELCHVLGFSSYSFPKFINPITEQRLGSNNVIRGNEIISPKVLSTARNHFSCSSLSGVETEDNGGSGSAGSHWEKRVLNNEFMAAVISTYNIYSEFTFALFEDSGWYSPVYSQAMPFHWGKGEGCSFVTGSCSNWDEPFGCRSGSNGCDYTGTYRGYCNRDTWADNCYYVQPYSNGDCRDQGAAYRCFESGSSSTCYEHRCTSNGLLEVRTRNGWATCPVNGGSAGGVTCPPASFHCSDAPDAPSCPNDCSGRGTCRADNTCACQPGWTGANCGTRESPKQCPDACSGHGDCNTQTGTCTCDAGFTGFSCALPDCPGSPDCSNRGKCVVSNGQPQCDCDDGYTGSSCAETTLEDCSGNGQVVRFLWFPPYCECDPGWTGDLCQTPLNPPPPASCPNDCSNRGECNDGVCSCVEGFTGSDCSEQVNRCVNDCTGSNGECISGECVCEREWKGAACNEPRCPYHPSCDTADPDPPTDDPSGNSLTGTVARGEYFTAYIDIPADGVLTIDLKTEGQVQSVLLLRRGEAPTIDVYDAQSQVVWYDFTSEQRIQEYVTQATYYISVHNPNWYYSASSFNFELRVSYMQASSIVAGDVTSPCPGPAGAECNDNGLCAQTPDGASFCECKAGFHGDECNFVVEELEEGETLSSSADVGQWVLFRFPVMKPGVLRVLLDKGRFENARPLLFGRVGQIPTLAEYDEMDHPGFLNARKELRITINFEEEVSDVGENIYIGVYNTELYATEAMDFFISATFIEDWSDGCSADEDCNDRGTCVEGKCECDAFYAGAHCSTPFVPQPDSSMLTSEELEKGLSRLSSKDGVEGTVDGELYTFFTFDVEEGKELHVSLSSKSGSHDVYGTKAAFPRTFYDFVFSGKATKSGEEMVIPASDEAQSYTIAVFASESGEFHLDAEEKTPGSEDEFPMWSIGVIAGGIALIAVVAGVVYKRKRGGESYNRQMDVASSTTSPRTMM